MNIAILTVSDSRTPATDTSGDTLAAMATADGHTVVARMIVRDNIYALRATVSAWIHDEGIEVMALPLPAALKGPVQ